MLRSPTFGNTWTKKAPVVQNRNLSGELRTYRNPTVPSTEGFSVSFEAVTDADINTLKDFLAATAGEEITIRDFEGRIWIGIITSPTVEIVRGRDACQNQFIRYESRIETYKVIDGDQETWRDRGCPTKDKTGPREYRTYVNSLIEAQGIIFLCPKCGGHLCEVTFHDRGVADELGTHNKTGASVRWNVSGTDFNDLTTTPSILLHGGCEWHGFITNGQVT